MKTRNFCLKISPTINRYLPPISTLKYSHIERINDWNEQNVVTFLINNNFRILLPILQCIDGEGLIEMHRVYEHSPKNLYKILSKIGQTDDSWIFFQIF